MWFRGSAEKLLDSAVEHFRNFRRDDGLAVTVKAYRRAGSMLAIGQYFYRKIWTSLGTDGAPVALHLWYVADLLVEINPGCPAGLLLRICRDIHGPNKRDALAQLGLLSSAPQQGKEGEAEAKVLLNYLCIRARIECGVLQDDGSPVTRALWAQGLVPKSAFDEGKTLGDFRRAMADFEVNPSASPEIKAGIDEIARWIDGMHASAIEDRRSLKAECSRLPFGPPRIVMLDDVEGVLLSLSAVVQILYPNAVILKFTDSIEAWEELLRQPPDLFTTDWQHEGIHGTTFLRLLVAQEVKFPVLVVSSSACVEAVSAIAGGKIDVSLVPKPWEIGVLLGHISRRLGQSLESEDDMPSMI